MICQYWDISSKLEWYTVFLQSDAAATIYFTVCFVRLLFKGGVYFFGKPGDINDGWIQYEWVRRWRLLDTVSSMRASQSCCQLWEQLVQHKQSLAWWLSSEIICTRVCVPHLVAMATIRGGHLFRSKPSDCAAIVFEGGVHSKKYGIFGKVMICTTQVWNLTCCQAIQSWIFCTIHFWMILNILLTLQDTMTHPETQRTLFVWEMLPGPPSCF